jgi:hypothetical protein
MNKQELHRLVKMFGLNVDYCQWEEKGWARINSIDWPELYGNKNNCVILYKEDDEDMITEELRLSLIKLGGNIKADEIRKALNIN